MHTIHKADGFEAQKLIVLPNSFLVDVIDHPLIRSVFVTDIGFFPHAQYHYRERAADCNSYIFIYCVEGQGWVTFDHYQDLPITANNLLIIPAHVPHIYGASTTNPWSIHWFHLQGELVAQFIANLPTSHPPLYIPPIQGSRIITLLNESYELLRHGAYTFNNYLYISQAMSYLLAIITLLAGEKTHDNRQKAYIEASIQYMLEHLQSSLTLNDLANHINLSKPHLIHLFKQFTGYSPIDYYLRMKMQHACQYLDLTNLSIKEISKNIGIADPYYFSRVFRKIIGQSPSAYRQTPKG